MGRIFDSHQGRISNVARTCIHGIIRDIRFSPLYNYYAGSKYKHSKLILVVFANPLLFFYILFYPTKVFRKENFLQISCHEFHPNLV